MQDMCDQGDIPIGDLVIVSAKQVTVCECACRCKASLILHGTIECYYVFDRTSYRTGLNTLKNTAPYTGISLNFCAIQLDGGPVKTSTICFDNSGIDPNHPYVIAKVSTESLHIVIGEHHQCNSTVTMVPHLWVTSCPLPCKRTWSSSNGLELHHMFAAVDHPATDLFLGLSMQVETAGPQYNIFQTLFGASVHDANVSPPQDYTISYTCYFV